ncbi:MAG: 16S rRNA (adenine(1518)-N(6)/adenine(1519)-N(6))-dimethyltransferase RsmA [Campylobacterota bacterium]|nr:16S rRNA (adenine(1518)-N(6)/adenine(1519)-N(6))-dimethyltransferase RsmA [Campylobacterota bacterium]
MKIVAKKKYGQNFLKDEVIVREIIEAMPKNENIIAEIGPGLGDLTKYLVNVKSVKAFEVDTDLCKILQTKFKKEINTSTFTLQCGDVLDSWKSSLLDVKYDLVANLPYYIATNIILKALADPNCENLLVMVQLEVAQKFAANSGDKIFGSLSVIAQSVGDVSIAVHAPSIAFDPPPKVDSAVLLIKKQRSRCDDEFEKMLRIAFTQPRKTLQKNLSSSYEKEEVTLALKELHVEPSIRPHQLDTRNYHQLYKILIKGTRDGRNTSDETTTDTTTGR